MKAKKEAKENLNAMQDYFVDAKNYFYENQDKFTAIYEILQKKTVYENFSIDYQGIHAHFVQEKDFVRMYSMPVEFTNEEIQIIEIFFGGYDHDRLEMLNIDRDARFTMFCKGNYENGRYKIMIVPAHPKNIYSSQALDAEPLDDNWVIVKVCESKNSQHVYIWERDETGNIVLGKPPYQSAP